VKRDLLWCFIELLQFNLHLRDGEVVQLNGVNIQVVREELRWHDPNGPGRVFPLTTIKRVEILEQTSKPKDETVP
jgi:hypothetical protein